MRHHPLNPAALAGRTRALTLATLCRLLHRVMGLACRGEQPLALWLQAPCARYERELQSRGGGAAAECLRRRPVPCLLQACIIELFARAEAVFACVCAAHAPVRLPPAPLAAAPALPRARKPPAARVGTRARASACAARYLVVRVNAMRVCARLSEQTLRANAGGSTALSTFPALAPRSATLPPCARLPAPLVILVPSISHHRCCHLIVPAPRVGCQGTSCDTDLQ